MLCQLIGLPICVLISILVYADRTDKLDEIIRQLNENIVARALISIALFPMTMCTLNNVLMVAAYSIYRDISKKRRARRNEFNTDCVY